MFKWLGDLAKKALGWQTEPPCLLSLYGGKEVKIPPVPIKIIVNINRVTRHLPLPEEGKIITLVGQGFCGDVKVENGVWRFDKNFKIKA